ncbi:hypothetical protein T484DRAFT_1779466 [Baffinella frigidus]|nr:hypothetical protein T484DRAFT_1779466 [Cryptophyta sp. CCMP2293]
MGGISAAMIEEGLAGIRMMGFTHVSDAEVRRVLEEHKGRIEDAIGPIISANESARVDKLSDDAKSTHKVPAARTTAAAAPAFAAAKAGASAPAFAADTAGTRAPAYPSAPTGTRAVEEPDQGKLVDSLTRLLLPSEVGSRTEEKAVGSPTRLLLPADFLRPSPPIPAAAAAAAPPRAAPPAVSPPPLASNFLLPPFSNDIWGAQASGAAEGASQGAGHAGGLSQGGWLAGGLPVGELSQGTGRGERLSGKVVDDGFTQVVPPRVVMRATRERAAPGPEGAGGGGGGGGGGGDVRLLVMVGIPGSGKSTIAKQLEARGWVWVSQDELGSRRRCEEAMP